MLNIDRVFDPGYYIIVRHVQCIHSKTWRSSYAHIDGDQYIRRSINLDSTLREEWVGPNGIADPVSTASSSTDGAYSTL